MSSRTATDQPWGMPVNLGPAINGKHDEGSPSMTVDGLSLYFHSLNSSEPEHNSRDIFVSQRSTVDSPWGIARPPEASFNTELSDGYPCVLPDGLTLIFNSTRPGGVGMGDLWMAQRASRRERWGEPSCLSQNINSMDWDYAPQLCLGGRALLFCTYRSVGTVQIGNLWIATRESTSQSFAKAVSLGSPVNTGYHETGAHLSADSTTLWFTALRAGGHGLRDLWYSRRVPKSNENKSPRD